MPVLNQSIKFIFNRYLKLSDLSFASGIPVPSLSRYKRQGIIPVGTNFNKMMSLYRQVQFRSLRVEGASIVEAKKFWSQSPTTVNKLRNRYAETVKRLAVDNDTDVNTVRDSIANSGKEAEEIFQSGL